MFRLFVKSPFVIFTFGILSLTLALIWSGWTFFFEYIYFRGIYQGLRMVLDQTILELDFPLIWIVFPAMGIASLWYVIWKKMPSGVNRYIWQIMRLCIVFFWIIILFYWIWGFNYFRQGLIIDGRSDDINIEEIYIEAQGVLEKMNNIRSDISKDTIALQYNGGHNVLESKVRHSLRDLISQWGIPVKGKVRAKALSPAGNLLRLSTLGIYMPYAGESYFDAGVADLHKPFIMAHELAHGYGFTDEGECNFLGILACLRSDDDFIYYSGLMAYWRYLASALRRADPILFEELLLMRSSAVAADHEYILLRLNAYPEILTSIRDKIYDSYLKSHGVKEGMASYGLVVNWMLALNKGNQIKYANVFKNKSDLLDESFNSKSSAKN